MFLNLSPCTLRYSFPVIYIVNKNSCWITFSNFPPKEVIADSNLSITKCVCAITSLPPIIIFRCVVVVPETKIDFPFFTDCYNSSGPHFVPLNTWNLFFDAFISLNTLGIFLNDGLSRQMLLKKEGYDTHLHNHLELDSRFQLLLQFYLYHPYLKKYLVNFCGPQYENFLQF